MRFLLFFLCLGIFSMNLGYSQFKHNHWSEPIHPQNAFHLQGIYSNGTKEAVLFTDAEKKSTHLSIAIVDTETRATQTTHYGFDHDAVTVAGLYLKPEGCVLVYSHITGKEGDFKQEVVALELKNGVKVNEKILASFSSKNQLYFGKVKMAQSPDYNKTLVFIESPYTLSAKEEFQLLVYQKNGDEEFNKKFSLDIDSKQNAHNYPQISNNGTIYFLKKDKEKNAHRYLLYAYNNSTALLSHKLISLPNAHITEIRGSVTEQNEFLVGGFTASEPIHSYEGYYLFKFDAGCSQKFKTQGQLDESTFLKFLSKKEYSKDPSLKNYYLDHIIQLSSGKIFMVAEAYTEQTVSKQASTPYYNDVMLLCFDEKGGYKTSFKHKKNQSADGSNAAWVSYKTISNSDTLGVIHNNLATVEGAKTKEPVLQFTHIHEKYGTSLRTPAHFKKTNDAPYFVPAGPIVQKDKGFTAVFSDISQKKFVLGYFEF